MLQSVASHKLTFPGRAGLAKDLGEKFQNVVNKMKDILARQKYVSTSADIWSSRCTSYLGMTVNYIDDELNMQTLVLCFKPMKGKHTFDAIASAISKVHTSFGLTLTKVTNTVTDGGSNFVKAFKIFANTDNADVESDSDNDNDVDDDDDNDDLDFESADIQPVIIDLNADEDVADISLPPQMRCVAHQLNLVCTSDLTKYLQEKKGDTHYVNTFRKLHLFWNKGKRSAQWKEKIKEKCGCLLPIPVKTRWNSLFDASKAILSKKAQVQELIADSKPMKLIFKEWTFLEEYVSLLQPIAIALDILQAEKNATLGLVLPTLFVVQKKLRAMNNLTCTEQLRTGLISNLKRRFPFMDLENKQSIPYAFAAVSHPKFKLNWIEDHDDLEKIKKAFIFECHKFHNKAEDQSSETSGSLNEDDFFSELNNMSTKSAQSADETLNESNFIESRFLSYINDKSNKVISLQKYDIIKNIFVKYNTTLPSSAPVERIFSTGLEIFTPRRNRLSPKVFEQLLFLKYNQHIVDGVEEEVEE